MLALGPLRFRRHLLAWLLVALLNELQLASEDKAEPNRTNNHNNNHNHAGFRRATRVRVASAQEIGPTGYETSAAAAAAAAAAATATATAQANLAAQIYWHDTRDERPSLWTTLAGGLNSLVPVINLNYSIVNPADRFSSSGHSDAQIDAYYDEHFPPDMNLDQLQLMSVRAADRMAPTPVHTSWAYASRQLAREGSLPVGDAELCSLQLAHLVKRLDQALRQPLEGGPTDSKASEPQTGAGPTSGLASPVDNFEARQMYLTGDLELMRYLDTFGKVPSELLRGNTRWYGAYESCLKTRLRPFRASTSGAKPEQHAIKFRYCMGAYKSQAWPTAGGQPSRANNSNHNHNHNNLNVHGNSNRSNEHDHHQRQRQLFIRLGLCLPEACDSNALELKDNWRALERLAKFNLVKPFNSDHYKLEQLYCPPDNRSPMRRIPLAGWLLLLGLGLWLLLVGGATLVQLNVDKFYLRTVERIRRDKRQGLQLGAPLGLVQSGANDDDDDHDELKDGERDILNVKLNVIKLNVYIRDKSRRLVPGVDLIDCLSFYSNWQSYTRQLKAAIVSEHEQAEVESRARALAEQSGANKADNDGNNNNDDNNDSNNKAAGLALKLGLAQVAARDQLARDEPERGPARVEAGLARVDTSALNALKVVALCWIIAGHCIFYLASAVSNGANMRYVLPTFGAFALIGGALYITELFFVITGCLTSYLLFKRLTRLEARDQFEASGGGGDLELQARSGSPATGANQPGGKQQLVALMDGRLFGPSSAPLLGLQVLGRYLRIVPTYLLVYALIKLVSVYIGGEGQLWDYAVSENSVRRACLQESWWPVLTLTSNFRDIYKHCIVGGWYLSADMQFAIMSVPFLLLLARCQRVGRRPVPQLVSDGRRKSSATASDSGGGERRPFVMAGAGRKQLGPAYALIFALGLGSVAAAVINTWLHSPVDLAYLAKFAPHSISIASQNILMYTNSLFRARAFLAGLLLGHLLYLYEFKLLKLPKFIQQHGTKLTLTILMLGFALMFSPILLHGKLIVSHDVTTLLIVLNAGAIDLFLGALIFLICIGKAPKAALFVLNSPMWSLLSALSLPVLLIHAEIIILLTSQLDPAPSVSKAILLLLLSATLLLTYGLAFVLHLSFELPVSRLFSALMLNAAAARRRNSAAVAGS